MTTGIAKPARALRGRMLPRMATLTIATMLLAGCAGEVTVPAADATAPKVWLAIVTPSEHSVIVDAHDVTVALTEPTNVSIVAFAEDDEGVRRIDLKVDLLFGCQFGPIPDLTHDWVTVSEEDPDATVGATALDERSVPYVLEVSRHWLDCANMRERLSLTAQLKATGENAHGGIGTSPGLTITYDPPTIEGG